MSDITQLSMEVEMRSMLRQHRVLMPIFLTRGTEVSKLINTIIEKITIIHFLPNFQSEIKSKGNKR